MNNSVKLDDIDNKILRELHDDARLTIQELSERIGLSASPCSRRVKMLEQQGVITGYSALINEASLGFHISAFISVRLDKQVDDALQTFEAAIENYPEVVDCWLMTGNRDYLMRVATRDLLGFEEFMTGRLTKIPGVASIESSIPLRRVKAGISRQA